MDRRSAVKKSVILRPAFFAGRRIYAICSELHRSFASLRMTDQIADAGSKISAHPIEKLVPGSRERQEPRLSVVQTQRRSGEWNPDKRILRLISRHHFRDLLPLIRRHGDTMPRIPDGEVHAIHLPGMRHDVEGEVERASPDIVDLGVAQLRIDIDHAPPQNLCALSYRLIALWKERGATTEQHSAIWCEPVVIKKILGVVNHPVARTEFPRKFLRQHFRREDERSDWDELLLQRRSGYAGVSAGTNK